MEKPYKIQEFVAHSTNVNCATFSPKSFQILATGGDDFKVNIWKVGSTGNLWTLGSNKSPVQSLCFDSDEQNIVSGSLNGSIKVFDLNEGRLARQLNGHQVNVSCLQYHGFGEFIVSGSIDCSMKVWDVRSKNCLQTYSGHDKEITCVRFSPDGRWVSSSSKDGQLHIWDLVAGKLLHTFKMAPAHITSFEYNPEDLILAGISSNRSVRLWDLETFSSVASLPPDPSGIRCMTFNPDGSSLYSASKDALRVCGVDSNAQYQGSVDMGWDRVHEIKYTPQNNIIGVSFLSNFVSLWSVEAQQLTMADAGPKSVSKPSTSLSTKIQPSSSEKVSSIDSNSSNSSSHNNNNNNHGISRGDKISRTGNPHSIRSSNYSSSPSLVESNSEVSVPVTTNNSNSSGSVGSVVNRRTTNASNNSDRMSSLLQDNISSVAPSKMESIRSYSKGTPMESGIGDELSGRNQSNRLETSDSKSRLSDEENYDEDDDFFEKNDEKNSNSGGTDINAEDANHNGISDDFHEMKRSAMPMVNEKALNLPPAVQWASEHAAQDLASSMGESFWKKHQLQQSSGLNSARKSPKRIDEEKKSEDFASAEDDGEEYSDLQLDEIEKEIQSIQSRFNQVVMDDDISLGYNNNTSSNSNKDRHIAKSSKNVKDKDNVNEICHLQSDNIDNSSRNGNRVNFPCEEKGVSGNVIECSNNSSNGNGSNMSNNRGANSNSSASSNSNSNNNNNNSGGATPTRPVTAKDQWHIHLDTIVSQPSNTAILAQRLTTVKVLRRLWEKGDLEGAFLHISTLCETSINNVDQIMPVIDFLCAVDWKAPFVSFDICVRIFPILDSIMKLSKTHSEGLLTVIIQTMMDFLDGFGDLIKQSLPSTSAHSIVDISREERSRKAQICWNVVRSIFSMTEDTIAQQHYSINSNSSLLQNMMKLRSYI